MDMKNSLCYFFFNVFKHSLAFDATQSWSPSIPSFLFPGFKEDFAIRLCHEDCAKFLQLHNIFHVAMLLLFPLEILWRSFWSRKVCFVDLLDLFKCRKSNWNYYFSHEHCELHQSIEEDLCLNVQDTTSFKKWNGIRRCNFLLFRDKDFQSNCELPWNTQEFPWEAAY